MANRIKLKGTTEKSFDLGLQDKFTLDASGFTANHTWVLPDSDGFASDVLTTDGSGNLAWAANPAATVGVPYFIPVANTFTVPVNFQALFEIPIDVEGTLDIDGKLVDVTSEPNGVPFYIASGITYRVPKNFQQLFTRPIDVEGNLVVEGDLYEVN